VVARNALRKNGFWRRLCYTAFADAPVRERHTVDHYIDCLAPLRILPADAQPPPGPALRLPPETVARARRILGSHGLAAGSFIVIHPGSARAEKYWLPERWAEVIDFCQHELALPCALTGGRGDALEQAHLEKIHAALGAPCADLSGHLDLLTLAAVLAEARLFVGVDSGPMHLAATWQKPQIVLFGPTNPFHWRPRHPGCRVLQAGRDQPLNEGDFQPHSPGQPIEGISTQAVISCIKTEIPAR
jgi:ADP-heptose:LPS heptosyltransferase